MDSRDLKALCDLHLASRSNVRGLSAVVGVVGGGWVDAPCRERLMGLLCVVALVFEDRFAWRVEPPGGQCNAPVVVSSFDESLVRAEYPKVGRVPRVFRVVEEPCEEMRRRVRRYGCLGVLEEVSELDLGGVGL